MTKRLAPILGLVLCVLALPVRAQEGSGRAFSLVEPYRETVERIMRAALSDGLAYERLADLCRKAPHRLSGSPGAAAAVEWARTEMVRLGFEKVRLEPCLVPHWVRGEVQELRVVSPASAIHTPLPILALGGSVASPEHGVTAEVVEVRDFEELERRAAEVKGKIVLFNRPMDPTLHNTGAAYGGAVNQRTQGAAKAAKYGAVGHLTRSMTTRMDDYPHTGGMRYEEGVPKIPSAAVSTLGAERISALIAAGEKVVLNLRLDCQTLPDAPSFNVVGEYRGSKLPDEVLVVGGHLDAWDVGQGAHDDGGGCCQAIESVRLLKALGLRPKRTIRVVLYMNEENGTRGATAYVTDHADEMEKHVLALESDSGSYAPRGFRTKAKGETRDILYAATALLDGYGAGKLYEGGGGADVDKMVEHGVPTVGLRPDPHRYFDLHHSERDTLDEVSPREINAGAGAMAALLYVIADLPETLPRTK